METKVILRRDVIRGVRDRWLEQYKHYADDYRVGWENKRAAGDIRKALAALDLETASVADVDAAIGVKGWGSLECDMCEQDMAWLIRIGDEPGYDSRWVDACPSCLVKASVQPPS